MSDFTSTSVNKGAVKVAPKARSRRAAAPAQAPPATGSAPSTRFTPGPTPDPSTGQEGSQHYTADGQTPVPTGQRRHRASSDKTSGRLIAPGRRSSHAGTDSAAGATSLAPRDRYAPVFEEAEAASLSEATGATSMRPQRAASIRRRSSAATQDAAAPVVRGRRASTASRQSPQAERRARSQSTARGRRKRERTTPADPNNPNAAGTAAAADDDDVVEQIDGSVRMAELCKGPGRGQKSKNYEKFKEMAEKKKRLKKEAKQAAAAAIKTNGAVTKEAEASGEMEVSSANPTMGVPQTRVVNGILVVDQDSLFVDRAARLAATEGAFLNGVIEIDNLARRVNSATYGKAIRKERWDEAETERFYGALSQWGTDFEMIAQMFPSRDRKQIKSKFVLEERKHPHLITRALIRQKPVDLALYAKQAAKTFRPVEELEAELQALRDRYEQERQVSMQEAEQRRLEMAAQAATQAQQGPVQETRKMRRTKRGDDGVEILGTVDEWEARERHVDNDN